MFKETSMDKPWQDGHPPRINPLDLGLHFYTLTVVTPDLMKNVENVENLRSAGPSENSLIIDQWPRPN